jgi:hypothetical protein
MRSHGCAHALERGALAVPLNVHVRIIRAGVAG